MSGSWGGALLGLALACGIALVIARMRATAPLSLRERVTPFVPYLRSPEHEQQPSVLGMLGALLESARMREGRHESRAAGGNLEQIAAVAAGVGIGALVGFALALRGSSGLLVIVLAAVGGVFAELMRSTHRSMARRRRAQVIDTELPDLAELFAFAVAAGESPAAALARVGDLSGGELGTLMRRAAAAARLGTPFDDAMHDLSREAGAGEVERFVDALLLAMERGTPLADLLRAQAADARAARSRRLMESAGRKDVAMLIPVVFMILPTVVLIALFPGFRSLHLFIN
ncbi:MAG: hypothetical protein RL205_494 [Actinomycetota bacterium]|jgi:tight adherence protein C